MPKLPLIFILIATLATTTLASSQNVTKILNGFPNYSTFNSLISKYGVASQINSRSTVTVLCPPNNVLDPVISSLGSTPDRQTIYDILSYHVLLDFFDHGKLMAITNGTVLVTTLYQSTGLATGNGGFVNITDIKKTPHVGSSAPGDPLKAIIGSTLASFPYNISCLSLDGVLVPQGLGAPSPAPAPVNITRAIAQNGNYSTFISLLEATGVDAIFQGKDTPPGITIFAPTNAAFNALPKGALAALTNAQKVAILEFHALPSYFSSQELSTLTGSQQTLASGSGGGSFVFTVSQSKSGTNLIDTGRNVAAVGTTLYSKTPVAIYSVDEVLLATDVFGPAPASAPSPTPGPSPASSPTPVPSPAPSSAPSSVPSLAPASSASPPAPPTSPTGSTSAPSPKGSTNFAASKSVNHALTTAFALIAAAWLM